MSWSIIAIGLRPVVKAKVLADQQIPEGLKKTIADLCDAAPPGASNGIRVETYGHYGKDSYSNIGKLEVQPVDILLPVADCRPVAEEAKAPANGDPA